MVSYSVLSFSDREKQKQLEKNIYFKGFCFVLMETRVRGFDADLEASFWNAVKSRTAFRQEVQPGEQPASQQEKKKRRKTKQKSSEVPPAQPAASTVPPVVEKRRQPVQQDLPSPLLVQGLVVDPAVVSTGQTMMEYYYWAGW